MSCGALTFTTLHDGSIRVSGNTFPYKGSCKALGGFWAPSMRSWILPKGTDVSRVQADHVVSDSMVDPPGTKRINGRAVYMITEHVKNSGGVWDPVAKEWIVPMDFEVSSTTLPGSRAQPTASEAPPSERERPHCTICRAPDHRRDRCQYTCDYCGSVGQHISDLCPTIDERWKRFVVSKKFACECTTSMLCFNCEKLCCEEAVLRPVTDDMYRWTCDRHELYLTIFKE